MRIGDSKELDCLLDEIRVEVRDTSQLTGRPALEQRVMEALRQTPRVEFVPHELRHGAYANRPLPIGHGQTISQPYVAALMTDLIQPRGVHGCMIANRIDVPRQASRPASRPEFASLTGE